MCCAGFPCAFGLPSTAAAQGNQPMISEFRAVTLVPGLEPTLSPATPMPAESPELTQSCLEICNQAYACSPDLTDQVIDNPEKNGLLTAVVSLKMEAAGQGMLL